MENVIVEVALEVISMYIAIASENKDLKKIKKLNEERYKIYNGDLDIIKKVIKQYGNEVKQRLEEI